MENRYRLYQVDSFTKVKLAGNPAGVVTNADGLSDQQMQKIARELNNSETAFIFQAQDDTYDVQVRFFTPIREVPICGHATIAAHYARAIENQLASTRVLQKTGAGILAVDIVREDDDYRMIMTQGKIELSPALPVPGQQALLKALGITEGDTLENYPIAIASTGHSKVMIGIKDMNILHGLRPAMDSLAKLSHEIGCNGYYVFTMHQNETPMIHGRMFAPAIGINEDPVTGNANGPLGAYLVRYGLVKHDGALLTFNVIQGEAIGRAGTMEVQVKIQANQPVEVKIAGHAVVAFSAELRL
jgi:PhzF family phenazine biosynthesis protein